MTFESDAEKRRMDKLKCENCHSGGHCAGCEGCRQSTELTALELALLEVFSETPFLPTASDKLTGRVLLLEPELDREAASLALRLLQRRGFVRVDADLPLQNASYAGFEDWEQGSAALTLRGQEAVDAMEYGGEAVKDLEKK